MIKKPLKIAIVVETFAKDMGYINNTLPKYISKLGHDTTIITSAMTPYYSEGNSSNTLGEDFSKRNQLKSNSSFIHEGFNVKVLPSEFFLGKLKIIGIGRNLKQLNPDIIFTFQVTGLLAIQCSLYALFSKTKLISGNHTGLSSSSLIGLRYRDKIKSFFLRKIPGYFASFCSFKSIVPTIDCGKVANLFFGINKSKIELLNLPVDEEYFYQNEKPEIDKMYLKEKFNIPKDEKIIIFSGKLSNEKNPIIIAEAIKKLRNNNFKLHGIFVGEGKQSEILKSYSGVTVLPFVPISTLGKYFRSSDIGIWTSESISFLDAACCGLPLILSDFVKDIQHVAEFTLTYKNNDLDSLCKKIQILMKDEYREDLSKTASELGKKRFYASGHVLKRLSLCGEN
jgi:glycosyltransferase involved in cell wall biosynthesis